MAIPKQRHGKKLIDICFDNGLIPKLHAKSFIETKVVTREWTTNYTK